MTHSRAGSSAFSPDIDRSITEHNEQELSRFFAAALQQEEETLASASAATAAAAAATSTMTAAASVTSPMSADRSPVSPDSTYDDFPSFHSGHVVTRESRLRQAGPRQPQPQRAGSVERPTVSVRTNSYRITTTQGRNRNHEQAEQMRRTIAASGGYSPDDLAPLSPICDGGVGQSPSATASATSADSAGTGYFQPGSGGSGGQHRRFGSTGVRSVRSPGSAYPSELPLRNHNVSPTESVEVTLTYMPAENNDHDLLPRTPFSPYQPTTPMTPVRSPIPTTRRQLRQMGGGRLGRNYVVREDEDMDWLARR